MPEDFLNLPDAVLWQRALKLYAAHDWFMVHEVLEVLWKRSDGDNAEFYQARYYLKEDLLEEPFRTGNGTVIVPDAPGLGAIVDEDRLRHYSIETRT